MPVFSILTATYNHEKYIRECILSVINQTFTDWEMIILDDGSTDKTGETARQFQEKDPRIRYHYQQNKGIFRLPETNNSGLQISNGKYISILEGDDTWEPEKLQKQFDLLDKNPEAVLCWGRIAVFSSETGKVIRIGPPVEQAIPSSWKNDPPGTVIGDLLYDNFIGAATISIRKSALFEIGGFQMVPGFPLTDYPTILKLATTGPFVFCPEIISGYRTFSRQVSKEYISRIMEKRIQFSRDFIDSLSPEMRSRFSVNKKQLEHHLRRRTLVNLVVSGRHDLIRKEYSSARNNFRNAMFYPYTVTPVWRILALTGILLSCLHLDMEIFINLIGHPTYSEG